MIRSRSESPLAMNLQQDSLLITKHPLLLSHTWCPDGHDLRASDEHLPRCAFCAQSHLNSPSVSQFYHLPVRVTGGPFHCASQPHPPAPTRQDAPFPGEGLSEAARCASKKGPAVALTTSSSPLSNPSPPWPSGAIRLWAIRAPRPRPSDVGATVPQRTWCAQYRFSSPSSHPV